MFNSGVNATPEKWHISAMNARSNPLISITNVDDDRLNIFKSLFKGREDVFARRWEKASKSGYMPAYQYDPHQYRLHKISGGSLK